MMKRYTHLIWDFNGTVLDDVAVGVESANALLSKHGLPPIPSTEAYRAVFGFPIREYYRRIGFDFEKYPFEKLAPEWVAEYMSRVSEASLYDGVCETIDRVRECGIACVLLSATEIGMLHGQLKGLGISQCFDSVLGLDNIHAVSKLALAEEWCNVHPDARPLFLGDTDHDFAVACRTGNDCVLFDGGHQLTEHLLSLGCPVIDRIPDVLNYL